MSLLLFFAPANLSAQEPTNVIFILTDDQGAWALGSYGNPEIRTPHLDALAAGGARFTNAFVSTPVCSPSRATFLTGRIPSQHGIHEWIREENTGPGARQLIRKETTLSEILAQRGYAVGISGKWHLGDSLHPQTGFTVWSVMPRGADRSNNARMIRNGKIEEVPGYITEVITDRALEFLKENRKKPFFLWVNYSAPHGPWSGHPERIVNSYRSSPFRSIPREGVHPWAIRGTSRHIGNRESLAQYFAAVTGIDEGVGRIMAALKQHGLTQRTLVIFASDHGFMVGHKGLWGKGNATQPKNLYDHSLRIPLIFHQPGRIPQAQEIDLHVSTYDFFPTVLDYLGVSHQDETLAG
ncbi:MAG: sulfatase-like hydrolase/transferase, partial [Acidobacteria bacterium]|nr:sulfatase-like hydrolase/transferase [Acidobacteriota bacterium]